MQRVLCVDQMQLGMCASGRMHGTALSVGRQVTTAAVFVEAAPEVSFVRSNVGGATVDASFAELMAAGPMSSGQLGANFDANSRAGRAVLASMRNGLGRVAPSPLVAGSVSAAEAVPRYELPDGTIVSCRDDEHRRCFEPLFDGHPAGGRLGVTSLLRGMLVTALEHGACGGSGRGAGSIVLLGGTTLADGFSERVTADVASFAKTGLFAEVPRPPSVVAAPERRFSEWIGGSIVASLTTMQPRFETRSAYDEEGARGVACRMASFL
jgi:hypothetical protein